MDTLLTGIFIRVLCFECTIYNLPASVTIETSLEITVTSVYVVLSTANKRDSSWKVHSSSERTGTDFSAVRHQSHQPARVFMSTPLGGGYIIFAFFAVRCPASGVRCPASRMVSAHLKEKY